MRELNTIQKRGKLNNVYAVDKVGNGKANHVYLIRSIDMLGYDETHMPDVECKIHFQNGARKLDDSIHGVLDVDLLEIVRDRLKGFQGGEFATEYNAKALEHLEIALMYMNRRVEDRIERNVLGTNEK